MFAVQIAPGLSVNLNLLQTFLNVADNLSFREAARKGGRSPATVSSQIKQLEEQLGVELFHRTTRTVTLSPDGVILFGAIKSAFGDIRSGLEQVKRRTASAINIACSSSIAWQILPTPIRIFRARYKSISVQVTETPAIRLCEQMLEGNLAFGIGIISGTDQRFDYEFSLKSPLVALIPRSMPQSRLSSITFTEISRLPLLLPPKTSVTRRLLEDRLRRCGVDPLIWNEELRFHTLMRIVEAGDGVAVFSAMSCRHESSPSYRTVPIRDSDAFVEIHAVRLRNRPLGPKERKLLDLVHNELTTSSHAF